MFLRQYFINETVLQGFRKFIKRPANDIKHKKTFNTKKIFSPLFTLNIFGFFNNNDDELKEKVNRYWLIDNIPALIEEADRLYCEENYLEVYEILNRLKYQDNVEVQWRICRALFKMSCDENKQRSVKDNMIQEAYNIITKTLKLNNNHSEVHKWMALILDMKSASDGIFSRFQTAQLVHQHMEKSTELNPEDPAILYMLGIWCYEISKLTWLEKQIAKFLFHNPRDTSKEQAYHYFLKAEQAKPRFFLGNVYMLGLCSYDLGMYFRARHYFKIASELPIKSDLERKFSDDAKYLAEKLEAYELNANIFYH